MRLRLLHLKGLNINLRIRQGVDEHVRKAQFIAGGIRRLPGTESKEVHLPKGGSLPAYRIDLGLPGEKAGKCFRARQ